MKLKSKEKLIEILFGSISTTALVVLICIFIFLFYTGIQAFSSISPGEFFFGKDWNPSAYGTPKWGILSLIIGTCIVTIGAMMIAIPIGIAAAIYLAEVADPKVREILKPAIEMIAGIPSVILGLIGILVVSPFIALIFGLSSGLNALTSSLIIALMIIPTIISITEDVLTSLPRDFREASLALGATRYQTIRLVLVPAAVSGIVAAIMLALGRAVGETMAVLMVSGNSRAFPTSFFDPVRPMTANIAIEIKEVVVNSLHYKSLFAIGLILFLMTFLINFISDLIIEEHVKKYKW